MDKVYNINICSDIFSGLRNDFDDMLKKTISKMLSKQCDGADVTIKLGISLTETGNENKAQFTPIFRHKVSTVMNIKDEKCGGFSGRYTLFYDSVNDEYAIREIDNGQIKFDMTGDEDKWE